MTKDYNAIKLKNGVQNAVAEALADIAVAGIENRIAGYKSGMLTADELLTYLKTTQFEGEFQNGRL